MPEDAIYIECRCGHRLSAWRILEALDRIIPGKTPSRAEVEPLLPRLRCGQCGARGEAEMTFAPSTANRQTRYVATERSSKNYFHRENCGWMGNVRREDEILFDSRDEAVRDGYGPCPSCRP